MRQRPEYTSRAHDHTQARGRNPFGFDAPPVPVRTLNELRCYETHVGEYKRVS